MKIAIINYQASNLYSISKAVKDLGADPYICDDPKNLKHANKIILPGVGSFAEAMNNIIKTGFFEELSKSVLLDKKPILGICLGMQLLSKSSTEDKFTKGLGFIDGNVVHLKTLGCQLRLPHIGWNSIKLIKKNNLFFNIPNNSDFYFANSFVLTEADPGDIIAKTHYDVDIVSVIKKKNIIGTQFHPEKSSSYGKLFIKNFLNFKYD
jgi:glutamine amidotransferase